uniref:Uncharacterized protein n=1 Tax=Plectus sambesii TaxID=2011161 RepID=A0A914VR78_9BILA
AYARSLSSLRRMAFVDRRNQSTGPSSWPAYVLRVPHNPRPAAVDDGGNDDGRTISRTLQRSRRRRSFRPHTRAP